jgi:pimeloyl-ACP methyl ester carboxylesterase
VIDGHEEEYIGFFLDNGLVGEGLAPGLRTRFIDSCRGSESLRCAFEFYRAFGVDAEQINRSLERGRLTVPTLAVGSKPVGRALHGQLQPLADDLTGEVIDNCGHVIPLDQPEQLAAIIQRFLHRPQ